MICNETINAVLRLCSRFVPGAGRDTPISEINLRHQNLLILRYIFSPLCCIFPILSPSAPRHVIDPAHIGQLGTQRLGMSRVSGLSGGGEARTRHAPGEQSAETKDCVAVICGRSLVGAMPAAGNLLETLGNLAGNYVVAQGIRVCCDLLRPAALRANNLGNKSCVRSLPNHGFRANRCVPSASVSRE